MAGLTISDGHQRRQVVEYLPVKALELHKCIPGKVSNILILFIIVSLSGVYTGLYKGYQGYWAVCMYD